MTIGDLLSMSIDERNALKKKREHAANILIAAKDALISECHLDEDAAKLVMGAIIAGAIPNVSVKL
jgi:hypothetical protein